MNMLQAAFLGVVQGVAEFLPISSSGHLVITQYLFGITDSNVLFDVFVHFATLLAVLIYFKKDIIALTKKEFSFLIVASIPAAFVGLLFEEVIVSLFGSVTVVALLLLVTGVLNLLIEWKLNQKSDTTKTKELDFVSVFIMGLAQAVAILPGISRSGSTVAASILQGVEREKAFRFSFLMMVPVVAGANLLQVKKVVEGSILLVNPVFLLVGGVFAFFSGLASLKLFEYVIKNAQMKIFAVYCFTVGIGLLSYTLLFS